jgi:hypothetical protein
MQATKHDRLGRDIATIVLAWIIFLAFLRVLQMSGFPVGFDVWPMGEDRNWLSWLQMAKGSRIAQLFWQTNDRNPLSPWWYIAFKPLIMGLDNGILIARYLMSLLCAVASYLCIRAVGGDVARWFALATGILCAVFTANGYIDNIYWNFIGALSMSLLCIWAYTRYLQSGRIAVQWYGISLVLWFFALSSYTLQSGAVLAIGYLAFSSPQNGSRNLLTAPVARLSRAIWDCVAYVGVFGIFLLIWKTTAAPGMAKYYSTEFSFAQLITSLSMAVWHVDFPTYSVWAGRTLSSISGIVAVLIFAVATFLVTRLAVRSDEAQTNLRVLSARSAFDIAVVAVCLVIPTLLVEASSSVWVPGTRWRMVHQFWVPLYLTAVLATAYLAISHLSRHRLAEGRLWAGLVGIAAAGIIAINFGHNKEQVAATISEKNLKNALAEIVEREPNIGHFIVKLDPGAYWISKDTMSPVYIKTFFPKKDVTLRIIPSEPPLDPAWAPWWNIGFQDDDEGIANAMIGGGSVPYAETRVLAFDGAKVRSLQGAAANEFAGLAVAWKRDQPLPSDRPADAGAKSTCSYDWNPTKQLPAVGFDVPEKDTHGAFRWTIRKQAQVTLPACDQPFRVDVKIAFALSEPNITGFALTANGTSIPLEKSNTSDGLSFGGTSVTGTDGKPLNLVLSVPSLDRPSGGPRELGVAVRQIKVRPVTR